VNVKDQSVGDGWVAYNADCIEVLREMPSSSVDYSVFSPPFASLYTYSPSERDIGNCKDHEQFYDHMRFLVPELLRVIKPGRLLSFHCMDLPTSKARDGVIGLIDFRGILIRVFEEVGWILHSQVTIWKDPVTAMQRTKALGLLHKQIKKDSAMSRQGIPDYLVTMRKPGTNPEPITHTDESFPVERWQRYASPVWVTTEGPSPNHVDDEGFERCVPPSDSNPDKGGINPSDTLQVHSAREEKDERHLAPLQLEVIRRAVRLWTNPRDVVLSPFMGIGSEGWVSLLEGRRFVGAELKPSYFKQAAENVRRAAAKKRQPTIFDFMPMEGLAQ
jgi:hypothetical protein